MSAMQTQAWFCPECLSDDHAWINGEYRELHEMWCSHIGSKGCGS